MVEKLFMDDITHSDELYRIIRDEDRCVQYKSYMEYLWETYHSYADKDFTKQLAQDFHSRFWEMYLTCTLVSNSFNVVPKQTGAKGPDILISDPSRRIFLEAITPSQGADDNPDKVPDPGLNTGKAERVPDTEIILRYSSAIADKYKKYSRYLEQGIVSSSDCYIIALNSCKIGIVAKAEASGFPRIMKSVLAIGDKEVTIGRSSGPMVEWHYQYRPVINRSSGSTVTTDLFLSDGYAGISGVLYSDSDVANHPNQMGDDFIFVHNPKSTAPVSHGYFKMGMEYFVELARDKFSISWQDWRIKA